MLSLTAKGHRAFMGHEKLHKLMDEDLCRNMMNFKNDDLKNFEVILQVIESQIEKYTELGKK
jgi:hypothetical protein